MNDELLDKIANSMKELHTITRKIVLNRIDDMATIEEENEITRESILGQVKIDVETCNKKFK